MTSPLPVTEHVALALPLRAALDTLLAGWRTLEDAVRWALGPEGPGRVAAVVVEDEYTHDVVLPWRDGRVLVLDAT